ncbi:LysR family transcriptional regulator ArgP [Arthrobacter tecti]
MKEIDPTQALALAAIIQEGSFDAAAAHLSITPSAVSQRIRALETGVGRPVLRRTRPVQPTETGEAIVRFARKLELLSADLSTELRETEDAQRQRIVIVINGDSLHTWALRALVPVVETLELEILREDQEHSLDLLRSGAAAAAITSVARPVQGCSSSPLGIMRYIPVCTEKFQQRWFSDGATVENLERAPVVVFDRKDDLQDQYLRNRTKQAITPPRHYVPAAQEFAEAIRLGMGWGLLAELELAHDPAAADLTALVPRGHVDVPLYWQQWRHGSKALEAVAAAIRADAAVLRPLEAPPSSVLTTPLPSQIETILR